MHRIESNDVLVVDGKNRFKNGPPGTKLNAEWCDAIQEEVCYVIEQMGITILTKTTDTKHQLWEALQKLGYPYDAIVSSQITFNNIIEKVAANHYQIKSDYRSAFFKNVTGGYNCTSWLSGGDTWGYIDTNQCSHIEFEAGAYIGCANTGFYLNINTTYALIENVWIRGNGAGGAITKSFKLAASNVKYINCKASDRYDGTSAIIGFQGSGIAANDDTSTYTNCSVYNQTNDTTGDNTGFYQCKNLISCYVDTITANNVACTISGFRECYNITNCNVTNLTCAGISYAFKTCGRANNIYIEFIGGSSAYGLYQCERISNADILSITGNTTFGCGAYLSNYLNNIKVNGITSTGLTGYGFNDCDYVSNCTVDTMVNAGLGSKGYDQCYQVSNCYVTMPATSGFAYGFSNCTILTGCRAYNVQSTNDDAYGFELCENLAGCNATNTKHTGAVAGKDGVGFDACDYVSSCSSSGSTTGGAGGLAEGFHACLYIAACNPVELTNTLNDYVNTDDASVTNKYSTPVSADGKWD